MAGKKSVFLNPVEQIHAETLRESRYVPEGPALIKGAPASPHQRLPTLRPPPGQRKPSERKLKEQFIVQQTRSAFLNGIIQQRRLNFATG